jgi:hypothetical protein
MFEAKPVLIAHPLAGKLPSVVWNSFLAKGFPTTDTDRILKQSP